MNKRISATAATAGIAGAALMYLMDPISGKRRRGLLWDKARHFSRLAIRGANALTRDTAHRLQGAVVTGIQALKSDEVSNDILVERVRSALGRAVTHPSSITVSADNGRVILTGYVARSERNRLLNRVQQVRGVRFIDDRVEVREEHRNGGRNSISR